MDGVFFADCKDVNTGLLVRVLSLSDANAAQLLASSMAAEIVYLFKFIICLSIDGVFSILTNPRSIFSFVGGVGWSGLALGFFRFKDNVCVVFSEPLLQVSCLYFFNYSASLRTILISSASPPSV